LGFGLGMLKRDPQRVGWRKLYILLEYLLHSLVLTRPSLSSEALMIGSILLLSDTEMIRIFAGAASALPLRFPLPFPSLSLSRIIPRLALFLPYELRTRD
jgi:hypothetical protein